MRILSYGHVKPKKQFCSGCGATYEYLPRDIKEFRPGTQYAKNFVRCPVCGNVTFVNDVLVKHDEYLTFQHPDRRYTNTINVDGYFENKHSGDAYTFRVETVIGFDGPPIGESIRKMIEQSICAVVKSEFADSAGHIGDPASQDAICVKAMMLTNIALSKITSRMNVDNVTLIALCPTNKRKV